MEVLQGGANNGEAAPSSVLRRTIAPALLILLTPPITQILWIVNEKYDASFAAYFAARGWTELGRDLPRPSWWAAAVIAGWCVFQWALLRWLPGALHVGPPARSGRRPEYRKNGVAAWVVTHVVLVGGYASGVLSAGSLPKHYGELLSTLTLVAFALCTAIYVRALRAKPGPDTVRTGYALFDFFQGIETHPRGFGVSLKQLVNCRTSMMGWSAIEVTLLAAQATTPAGISPALAVSALLVVVYLAKFFWWETGYFASLDVMHDRFGYYICWGVLAWVPAVYPIAQLYLSSHRSSMEWRTALVFGALGLAAIGVNYAADAQRQRTRATNGVTLVWRSVPSFIVARYRTDDGRERENLLLVSGYWGLSRHFHYLPEITLAFAWTAPAGFARALPWVYVAFLSCLLVDRANRDDERCARKYGRAWDEYRARVPFKIVPGVY